jgi:hypothetical protein
MCRNIKTLFNFEPPATELEIHDASLQFVRKLSGFNAPSQANKAAATHEIVGDQRRAEEPGHRGDQGAGTLGAEFRIGAPREPVRPRPGRPNQGKPQCSVADMI